MSNKEQLSNDVGHMKGLVYALKKAKSDLSKHKDRDANADLSAFVDYKSSLERRVKYLRYRFYENYGLEATQEMVESVYPDANDNTIQAIMDSIVDKVQMKQPAEA